jgi:hypothetical protein
VKNRFSFKRFNIRKHYIVTKPGRVSEQADLVDENDISESDLEWLRKSRRLQARRWRKLKYQHV